MAEILIVAATIQEVAFLKDLSTQGSKADFFTLRGGVNNNVDVLITGPGIAFTVYHLTKVTSRKKYDLAVNIGICGSLDPSLTPVRLVHVTSDSFGDFGATDGASFLDIFELGLMKRNQSPFKDGKLRGNYPENIACLNALPSREGITVQRVHGSAAEAKAAYLKFGPVMESMEGAAFRYVCLMENITSIQVRAVSNKVEKRNRPAWKIKEAISALEGFTGLLLLELENAF